MAGKMKKALPTIPVTAKVSIPRAGEFEVTLKLTEGDVTDIYGDYYEGTIRDAFLDRVKVKILNTKAIKKRLAEIQGNED